jgi:hypothetical protein
MKNTRDRRINLLRPADVAEELDRLERGALT